MCIFIYFILPATICFQFSLSSQVLIPPYQTVTNNFFSVLHERFMVGLILISFWEEEDIASAEINLMQEVDLPYAVIGRKSVKENIKLQALSAKPIKAVLCRYNKPYVVHTNTPLSHTSWKSSEDLSLQLWTKLYTDLLGQPESDADGVIQKLMVAKANSNSLTPSSSLVDRLLFRDFFVNIQVQTHHVLGTYNPEMPALKMLSIVPRNSLWLVFKNDGTGRGDRKERDQRHFGQHNRKILKFDHAISYGKSQLSAARSHLITKSDNVSNEGILESITVFCPFCSPFDQIIFSPRSIYQTSNTTGGNLTKLGYLMSELIVKSNHALEIELRAPMNTSTLITKYDNMISNERKASRNLITSTRSLFCNPLVFISRKSPSLGSEQESVLNPFTLASWIGIVVAYAVTTIAFEVVKAVTCCNFDQSLYEYVMEQLLKMVNEDRLARKKMVPKRAGTDAATISLYPDMPIKANNNNNERDDANEENKHGKTSKAILHGTIRIVSFVMIATYEGKLYNSITFPKSRLISSFEDLLASEPYAVKVTNEAEQNGLAGLQFDRFMMRNDSEYKFKNITRLVSPKSRIMDSVNIDDCINWVESTSDPNHACIGYEFELRNLHKTQRFDKLLVKSNKKLGKYGYGNRRRGSRLFPGAFQISKWIVESGIMQLWNIAESSFTESINPDKMSQSKVFTIRDYLGLFIIFFILLLLASIIFLSEVGVGWAEERLKLYSVKDYWHFLCRAVGELPNCIADSLKKLKVVYVRLLTKRKIASYRVSHC